MNQPLEFRMEIRRQSGEIISGKVPVNQVAHARGTAPAIREGHASEIASANQEDRAQGSAPFVHKDFVLGSASVRLEARRSGPLQTVTLHLALMQEDHWVFDGLEQKAPVRVFVPLDPKPEKMTALYLFSDWWTRPAFVARFEDIPAQTQVLLLKGKEGCACLVPMVGRQWKATVHGGTQTELCLELGAGVGGFMGIDEPLYVLAEGETVSEAVHGAFAWLAREKGILMRRDRRIPDQFRSLGWCSWDAFYTDVDEAGLRQKAAEFSEKSIPVRWMIIDDGWMTTRDTFLTDYAGKGWTYEPFTNPWEYSTFDPREGEFAPDEVDYDWCRPLSDKTASCDVHDLIPAPPAPYETYDFDAPWPWYMYND